ncbi:hypothetical protein [Herbaspirillum sp. YR522]|uniref:hypothetical protein n=1 Tax=Herbaspirillum sp. YR522 TaxID=1144342 RepID=UPI00026FA27A|nr:hypothetical protein [Herbaspirillum sp. YR522]EJN07887.1 hypothetical protein PMI40_01640 [Herbaspirillum sp. YR522]
MDTPTLLVEHYMLLIKNIAYLAANGVAYIDRMESIVARAVEHLCIAHVADAPGCRALLSLAIEDELHHLHSQHPEYADSLQQALVSLAR